MPSGKKEKRIFGLICTVAAVTGLWLFRPAGLYFLNDDLIHIPLSAVFTLVQRNSWRPVCDLSVTLDYYLWGKNAAGYHFTNLLLHLVNTFLVGLFARQLIQLLRPGANAKLFSIISGVLFFVYAFHSETIFWIIGRSASLGLLFTLPACIFFLSRNSGKRHFLLALLFFQVGLLTYETIWMFPLLAGIFSGYSLLQKQSALSKEIKMNSLIWLVFAANLALRYRMIGEIWGKYEVGNVEHSGLIQLVSGGLKMVLRSFLPPTQSGVIFFMCGVLFLLAAALVFFRMRKTEWTASLLLVLCLLVSYVPCLSLSVDTHGVESERYLYLPSVFAVLLFAWILVYSFSKYRIIGFLLLVGYHLWFLALSRQYFQQASIVTQSAFQQINLLQNKKRLFVDSLPTEIRGALIFRLGFEEGLQWMKQSGTVDTVYILSRKEADAKPEMTTGTTIRNIVLYSDTLQPSPGKMPQLVQFPFNPATDAYMIFKGGKWLIRK